MDDPILIARQLAMALAEQRLPNLENDLSRVFRDLSAVQQLEIIVQLLQKNVRAAATIAARGHLPVPQQLSLLQHLLESGQTNAIKVMVCDVFAHRMGAEVFANSLGQNCSRFPKSVNFAAYYFLGASKMSTETRRALQSLLEKTKPSAEKGA
jgi:hypothetical protein